MKTCFFVLVGLLGICQLFAQNVGIGTTNPIDNLHIHSSSVSAGITLTNQFSGMNILNVVRIGYRYEGANAGPDANYFFYNLPSTVPFVINQGFLPRFTIGSAGNLGIGMAPYNSATLSVNGDGRFYAKGNTGAFVLAADTTTTITSATSGFSATKRLSSGFNSINLLMRGNKSQAYIEARFKTNTANQRSTMIMFDSTGDIGIGTNILDSALDNELHLFGSQTIQSGRLQFYGPDENFDRGDQEITFSYNGFGDVSPDNPFAPNYNYFIRHNNRQTSGGSFFVPDPEYKRGTFAIGRYQSSPAGWSGGLYWEGDRIAIAQSPNYKVGIGRYPSTTDAINKIFVDGNTHFSASRITLDRPADADITTASLEFRNGGTYRGALGWDQSAGRFFFFDGESNTNTLFINNGRIGIQRDPTTNALEVAGNASKSSAGDWIANSDERLKKHIAPLQNPLEKLLRLQGVTYEWNDTQTSTNRPAGTHMGFTAQNIQQVFPELVSKDAQGFLQTAYGTYDALYVEAIRQLVKRVEDLENQLKQLKNEKK